MKCIIPRESLLKTLKAFAPICNKTSSFAVLKNILIKASNGELWCYGTDLNSKLILKVQDVTIGEEGVCLVSLKSLESAVSGMGKGQDISINAEKSLVRVECGKACASLPKADELEFPSVEKTDEKIETSVDAISLVTAIQTVLPAVAKDEMRKEFTGVWFADKGGDIEIVSTDGHRMNLTQIQVAKCDNPFKEGKILSAEGLSILAGALDGTQDIYISDKKNSILFSTPTMQLSIQLIQGQFPDFSKVIPEHSSVNIIVDKSKILNITKAVSAFAPKSNCIHISGTKDTLYMDASSDNGKGDIVHSTECESDSKSFDIGANVKYMMDAVSLCQNDQIEIGMINYDYPIVIKSYQKPSDRAVFIVMPMQL